MPASPGFRTLSCGCRARADAGQDPQLLGKPVLGGVDHLPAAGRSSRRTTLPWQSSSRPWWMPERPGVMFTRSPLTGDRSVMAIEGSWGLGSAVVGGEVTPDRWVIGKITGEISVRDISDKHIRHDPAPAGGTAEVEVPEAQRRIACMSDEELQALRTVGRKVERHYGCPQDIEWAVDRHSGALLLLQSRPETVWSTKEVSPVGRAAVDPSLHVLKIFGGIR